MSLNPISSNIPNLLPTELTLKRDIPDAAGGFADIFKESFANVAATDKADKMSAIELLAGEANDMSGLLLDIEKAEIALNLALQIRNKVLDAYDTVMRMSL